MKHVRYFVAAMQIMAVYGVTILTAVACGKFEAAKVSGKSSAFIMCGVTASAEACPVLPVVGEEPKDMNMTIGRVSVTVNPSVNVATISAEVKHGTRPVPFSVTPNVRPTLWSSVQQQTMGNFTYNMQAVCANTECTVFGLMLTARNETTKEEVQNVQLWDMTENDSVPKKQFSGTDFASVTAFVSSQTGVQFSPPVAQP